MSTEMEVGPSSALELQINGRPADGDSIMSSTASPPPTGAHRPAGPVCNFGSRLAYTYFDEPVPTGDQLNEADPSSYYFTIDQQLVYLSFFQDTGPLNVAMFYRFALHLHSLLDDETLASKKMILYSANEPDKKANSALLIALYAMIVMRWSPADALHPIACLELQPFRDAGYARADFHLSIQDVLFGMKKAIDLRLLRLDTFDVKEYEMYEKVENGDWNFITPHFLAFASPVEHNYVGSGTAGPTGNKLSKAFRNVLEQFTKKGVKTIVRLNKKLYATEHFTDRGFEHIEMYFDDGTNPTMDMCREFIALAERTIKDGGVVAVHCKAGLGRTGTLIGAYMIYKWGFTASETIGFMRMMRPGSVVGPQQHFLSTHQLTWVKWAALDGADAEGGTLSLPAHQPLERPITPPSDHETHIEPVRPSTPTNNVPVPGQPRKTPGRTRHAVAAPETAPQETEDVMEGIISTPSVDSREVTPRETTPTDAIAANHTPSAGLRSRGSRPLSAITDNRVVNHIDTGPPSSDSTPNDARGGVTRSKGSRNLLFQEAHANGGSEVTNSGGERYNLRRDPSSRSPPTSNAPSPGTLAASGPAPSNKMPARPPSPSRLPQRVAAKRRIQSRHGPHEAEAATKLARNVRRRRSSMGNADIMG